MSQQSGPSSNEPNAAEPERVPPDAPQPSSEDDDAAGTPTGYGPPPPVRSAYPGPEEGGFYIAPVLDPDEQGPPGPGYGPTGPAGAPVVHQGGSMSAPMRAKPQDQGSLADIWPAASAATPSGGPGASGADTVAGGVAAGGTDARGEWTRIGTGAILAVLLGAITMVGFALVPAVATVAALVVIAVGVVLSWPTSAPMRHIVLLALAGPAGVLLGYWLIRLVSG